MITTITEPARTEKLTLAKHTAQTVASFEITSQEENIQAEALRVDIKGEIDALEAQRVKYTKPLLDHKRAIDADFKPLIDAFQDAYRRLGVKIANYVAAVDAERRLALRAATEAHNAGDHETGRRLTSIVSDTAHVQVPTGTSVRYVWKVAEIVEPADVPREYCEPSSSKLNAFAKTARAEPGAPAPVVAGVVFELVPIVTTQTKGRV